MISVVGAGGVGGLLAALLVTAGEDVTVVLRPGSAARVAAEGLRIRSRAYGDLHVRPPVATVVPQGSIVLITVKEYGLDDVLPGIAAAGPSEVLCLLNGVTHADRVHSALPGPRVACGSALVLSTRDDAGVITVTTDGIAVTVPSLAASWQAPRALAGAGVSVTVHDAEREVLWTKFRRLAPFALLTSWVDGDVPTARRRDPALVAQLLGEVAAVATADGLPTDRATLDGLLPGPGGLSSLATDLRRGTEGELHQLGDALIELGGAYGIATPALERVVREIRARVSHP